MIQAIIRNGKVYPEEVPPPIVEDGKVLIKVHYSAISPGTEISSVKGSSTNIIHTAFEQPEKVIKYLKKIKTNGFQKVYNEIKSVTEGGKPTGYSISGEIIAIGKGVTNFAIGEKVAATGGGFAYHAEFVVVPANLVIKIPQNTNLAEVSSVAIGGIALQGVRRAGLALGEFGVVFGVGLIGILTVQMLRLSGVSVIAIDIDDSRLEKAKQSGADFVLNPNTTDVVNFIVNLTGGYGCDAVLFTAATGSSDPISLAFKMLRKKGKLILVGVSGMDLKREDIYEKEIDFLVSTSYGPGRYDKTYEEKNVDYPYSYVRWTENRNMAEYCRLLSKDLIDLSVTDYKIFNISVVESAYTSLGSNSGKDILVILEYDKNTSYTSKKINISTNVKSSLINVAIIGTGSFALNMHIPNLKRLKNEYNLYSIMSRSGHNAKNYAELYGASNYTTDYEKILNDKYVDLVLICNRHENHYDFVMNSLREGKNTFVEKPLCTTLSQLRDLERFFDENHSQLPFITVGYNRRFSPYAERIKKEVKNRVNPLFVSYRMNAGYVPRDNWVHEDGGRMVGESCHIVDLMNYLTESKISAITHDSINPQTEKYLSSDNKSMILRYEDGSICNVQYFALGSDKLTKEYMEIHFDGKSITMDNYQQLDFYGLNIAPYRTKNIEKGHFEELQITAEKLKRNELPIELWDLIQTSEITLHV